MFFDLVQLAVGNRTTLEQMPSKEEWQAIYEMACQQSLAGVMLEGVNRIKNANPNDNINLDLNLLFEWIGLQQQIIAANKLQNKRAAELCEILEKAGFKSCVLKGQGTALYYEHPEYRQCGDIDIWVSLVSGSKFQVSSKKGWDADKSRDEILEYARQQGLNIGHIDIKHSDIDFFKDVPVEVHFLPSWMYNPSTIKRLQKFFAEQAEHQFSNFDERCGFTHTTIEFDLVYSMVHIYRHIFSDGIGLRQLMDYYYILMSSSVEQRKEAYNVLKSLRMAKFVGGVMWILRECFRMEDECLLCPVNERHGKYLLSEILTAGNFGQYDERMLRIDKNKRFERGLVQLRRNWRFVRYYPSEVLWSPFWKLWHYAWRKRKGYL